MGKKTLALLFAGCFGLYAWAQAPQEQTPPQQTPAAEQKTADQNHPPEQPSAVASAPATETTQYPLDQFQNFSAMENGAPIPGFHEDKFIYRAGKMMRMQGEAVNYFVTDLAKQQTHAIAPAGCLAMGSAYIRAFPFWFSGPGITYERTPIGQETVDGHECRVEDIKIHNPKNPAVMNFRLYEAEDLQGFPIKIENRREHTHAWVLHYKDVKLGPQDPTLFIVPDQCQSSAGFVNTGPKAKKAPPAKTQNAPPTKPQ
jgi:hypothetical protein